VRHCRDRRAGVGGVGLELPGELMSVPTLEVAPPAPKPALPVPRGVRQSLAGWGNFRHETCQVYRPMQAGELRRVVASAPEASVISRGLGRAYGDAAVNGDGGVIAHAGLDRLLGFDAATGVLTCEAGASIGDIIDFALPRGWFPAVAPGTRSVSVGGAIAADVHGKNHHLDGSFAAFVLDFRLLLANGDLLTCSPALNADVFWATAGGMGLTGALVDARLQLRPIESAYVTVDYRRTRDLDESLSEFARGDAGYPYSVAWIDCLAKGKSLGRSVLMRGRHTPLAELPTSLTAEPLAARASRRCSMPCHLPRWALNSWSVGAFNALYYRRHGDRRAIVHHDPFFFPLDAVSNWNRIYGRRGFAQYQAVFPHDTSRCGLVSLLEAIARSRQASFLAVLKSLGPGNEGLLSFPQAGHTLAIDLPHTGETLLALLDALDAIVLAHGGRVYLAKDPRLGRAAFEQMYPRADEFRAIKSRLDPEQRFASSLARRIGLAGNTARSA
jgi:decaprenylphospho-beta-D-ribofuranose 2-oxidase